MEETILETTTARDMLEMNYILRTRPLNKHNSDQLNLSRFSWHKFIPDMKGKRKKNLYIKGSLKTEEGH